MVKRDNRSHRIWKKKLEQSQDALQQSTARNMPQRGGGGFQWCRVHGALLLAESPSSWARPTTTG